MAYRPHKAIAKITLGYYNTVRTTGGRDESVAEAVFSIRTEVVANKDFS